MLDVAEKLQDKYEKWLEELSFLIQNFDEDRAFELFWIRMSPGDAAEVLEYNN